MVYNAAAGTFTYTPNPGATGTDSFTYTITDGDGDASTATVTVNLDTTPLITNLTPAAQGGDVSVDEDDLSDGSSPNAAALTQTGTFNISAPDGVKDLTIAGHAVITGGVFAATSFTTALGNTLAVTGYNAGTGVITYTYALADNEAHANAGGENNLFESLAVVLTDTDGDAANASLDVRIIDDVPTASANVVSGAVDEDGVAGGNPGGGASDLPGEAVVATGSVAAMFTAGADNPLAYALAGDALSKFGALNLTSGGVALAYSLAGSTVTAKAGAAGPTVFTFQLSAAGTYTFTLVKALDHVAGNAENDLTLNLGAVVTATDTDGDPTTGSASGLVITVDDDTSNLGAFTNATLVNAANAVANGTFAFSAGADGWQSFAISPLTNIPGLSYATTALANGAKLTATATSGGATIYELTVLNDGTYAFKLVTPQAGSTETFSLLNLTAGGPQPWTETPDGRVEFTGNGNGVNSSTQGFGVDNQFVAVGESFTMEFHNPGAVGDQLPSVNPYFVDSVTLSNNNINGALTIKWTATNTQTGQTQTGTTAVTGSSTLIDPTISFNLLQVDGLSGSGQGVRFSAVTLSKTILPQSLDLAFSVTATDKDGDVTSAQNLAVHVDAGVPPVAIDLDGDGIEFISQAAGVAFAHDGDTHKNPTAWVGPDDGLLVFDEDGDRAITHEREYAFASRIGGILTDLEAVRAEFDTNQDGKLTAADERFASFGVWQDANSDGISQPGEFKTLAELGIVSIDLVSDGKAHPAAGGQVNVFGEATFTRQDGSTGIVADVAFGLADDQLLADNLRNAQLTPALVGGLAAAGVVAAIAAATPPAAGAAHDITGDGVDSPTVKSADSLQHAPAAPQSVELLREAPLDNHATADASPTHLAETATPSPATGLESSHEVIDPGPPVMELSGGGFAAVLDLSALAAPDSSSVAPTDFTTETGEVLAEVLSGADGAIDNLLDGMLGAAAPPTEATLTPGDLFTAATDLGDATGFTGLHDLMDDLQAQAAASANATV